MFVRDIKLNSLAKRPVGLNRTILDAARQALDDSTSSWNKPPVGLNRTILGAARQAFDDSTSSWNQIGFQFTF